MSESCGGSPGFTSVVVLSLALGIGANTAIFSLVHVLLLRTLPVLEPERLVELLSQYPGGPRTSVFSWRFYEYFRDHNHVLSALIASSQPADFHLDDEIIHGEYISGNLFSLLGMKPAVGRLIAPADNAGVAVLNWSFWNRRFQLNPAIVGRQIILDNLPTTVIGVTPREFSGLQAGTPPDVWVMASSTLESSIGIRLMGQLNRGASLEQARAEIQLLNRWRVEELAKTSKDPQVRLFKMDVDSAANGFSSPATGTANRFWRC